MKKKVVVLDDDQDTLESIRMYLNEEGFEVTTVSQWEKIHSTVLACKPDIVIVDVQLYGMDGRIICRDLKNSKDTAHIPVIIISAFPLSLGLLEAYRADDFIRKPFRLEELHDCMMSFIH